MLMQQLLNGVGFGQRRVGSANLVHGEFGLRSAQQERDGDGSHNQNDEQGDADIAKKGHAPEIGRGHAGGNRQ